MLKTIYILSFLTNIVFKGLSIKIFLLHACLADFIVHTICLLTIWRKPALSKIIKNCSGYIISNEEVYKSFKGNDVSKVTIGGLPDLNEIGIQSQSSITVVLGKSKAAFGSNLFE